MVGSTAAKLSGSFALGLSVTALAGDSGAATLNSRDRQEPSLYIESAGPNTVLATTSVPAMPGSVGGRWEADNEKRND